MALRAPSEEWVGGVTAPLGYKAAAVHAGLKRRRPDLALLTSARPATVAGVFTTNRVRSPVVDLAEAAVRAGRTVEALVVVSGNANACTGPEGRADAEALVELAAVRLGLPPDRVLVAATGVIGVRWPMATLAAGIAALPATTPEGGAAFAQAICTTDRFPKTFQRDFTVAGRRVTVGATAKGSGMIHPDLATTLAFVTTDALVAPQHLDAVLREAVADTLNAVSVDGDTSTNDMALLLANGCAEVELAPGRPGWDAFRGAVRAVLEGVAEAVARDGEGASLLFQVDVLGAANEDEARKAARAVAASTLVKSALHGRDPNFGRIAAALGRSGATLDARRLTIALAGHPYLKDGRPCPGPERLPDGDRLVITCHLGVGHAQARAFGCDLSTAYVVQNSRYRT